MRELALADPRGSLGLRPKGAIVDEAQHAPALFSYLQTLVDSRREPGLFVLTGSQQFGLLASISQSLAGRVGLLHLLPFGLAELEQSAPPRDLGHLPDRRQARLPPDQPSCPATHLKFNRAYFYDPGLAS